MSSALQEILHSSCARAALVLLVGAGAAGCTAGEVTYNGTTIHQHAHMTYAADFFPVGNAGSPYMTQITWSTPNYPGIATFSFDPSGPATTGGMGPPGVSNSQTSLPAGEYTARVYVYGEGALPMAVYMSQPFQHSYPAAAIADDYNGSNIPTRIYNFEILPKTSVCPQPTVGATSTTVPVCAGPEVEFPPSTFF